MIPTDKDPIEPRSNSSGEISPADKTQPPVPYHSALEEPGEDSMRRVFRLLDNVPAMAYRCRNDPSWTMDWVSQGCLPLTGYEPEDLLLNRRVAYGNLIHPDDRGMVWDTVEQALARREPFELVYRIRTAAGELRWVWERGFGVFGPTDHLQAIEGLIIDITARVEAEEKLRRAQEDLERQVAQRTAQLSETNEQLRVEIQSRIAAEEVLRSKQRLLEDGLAVQERERQILAYEIHDSLAQDLTGLLMLLDSLLARGFDLQAELRSGLEQLRKGLRATLEKTRLLISRLRSPTLEDVGLSESVAELIRQALFSHKLDIELQSEGPLDELPSAIKMAAFRIVQEALTNAIRHSRSDRILVRMAAWPTRLELEVRDWGVGFDPDRPVPEHFGLEGIRKRAELLGGKVTISSTPGGGTQVLAEFPLEGGAAP